MNLVVYILRRRFLFQETLFSETISNLYKNLKIHQCPLNGPGVIVLLMMALHEKTKYKQIPPIIF